MSNPKLMAEDVTRHYINMIKLEYPHTKNVRRYLRLPLLAVTRRILLPRVKYAEIQQVSEVGTFDGNSHIDPSFSKCKDGLDWRDYVESFKSLSTDTTGIKSETEISDFSDDNQRCYMKSQPHGEMKLSRRTLARMEAFLASCELAVPDERMVSFVSSSTLQQSNNVSNNPNTTKKPFIAEFKSLMNIQSKKKGVISNGGNKKKSNSQYPQIRLNDLTLRIDLYIRNLRRIHAAREQQLKRLDDQLTATGDHDNNTHIEFIECVMNEPLRISQTRIQIILKSLLSTTNSVGSMRGILTKLLSSLTRELLAVEHLSEQLNNYIRKIILEYEHLTSFASLAFLSSPGDSAETHLSPLIMKFMEYLRSDWEMCVEKCKIESMLSRAIDSNVRQTFKTVEFQSIGHLLEICNRFHDQLKNIIISPNGALDYLNAPGNNLVTFDGSSNIKISCTRPQDTIDTTINGGVSDVSKCCSHTTKVIKQALRDLRREIITINGNILPPVQSLTELCLLLRERLNSRTMKLKDRKVSRTRKKKNENGSKTANIYLDSDSSNCNIHDIVSSGNEGDTDGSKKAIVENNDVTSTKKNDLKRRHFNVNAIDIMTRRLLIAASRTRSGGDALFVVQDLFGGEGIAVLPHSNVSRIPYAGGKISPTIEMTVRLSCIIIKCHSTFNVYPESYIGEHEALIQLHTTTTETIELQEVRVDDDGNEIQIITTNDIDLEEKKEKKPTKLMLKEKKTEFSGRRILSINPARYERVENWHTPS